MKNIKRTRVGLEQQYGPRLAGEILHDYLENSNKPLARAYREHLFYSLFPNTEPCCQLKLLTRKRGRLNEGSILEGVITRSGDEQYVFVEKALKTQKLRTTQRNAHIYRGVFINVHMRNDGIVYPTLCYGKLYSRGISFKDFCYRTAKELCAIGNLIEELYPER